MAERPKLSSFLHQTFQKECWKDSFTFVKCWDEKKEKGHGFENEKLEKMFQLKKR